MPNDDQVKRSAPPSEEKSASTGLEGASEKDSGILRDEEVEGGEELSIGGSPPSGAGGTRESPAPTRWDMDDN